MWWRVKHDCNDPEIRMYHLFPGISVFSARRFSERGGEGILKAYEGARVGARVWHVCLVARLTSCRSLGGSFSRG